MLLFYLYLIFLYPIYLVLSGRDSSSSDFFDLIFPKILYI